MAKIETATLGGGCFWCLEAVYQEVKGVEGVVSGYAGGHVPNPTYEQVCGKQTGHAEVVQVRYDADVVSFEDLLDIFFTIHDPTTLNRQGNDVGPQYRSAIYVHDEGQKAQAEAKIAALEAEGLWPGKFTTEVARLDVFYPAEEYHQNYFKRNPFAGYCMAVVAPKVAKFRKMHLERLRA
ncbi:MAG: peptide-methionine (S)-S-oxide reductase MsrA [Chloroflexi bacterium]|nr:peptide-methionine (S)-S-oxide reductase MsrA [Chloroflexota bacterium]